MGEFFFHVKMRVVSMELPLRNSKKHFKNLWVKTEDRTNKGQLVVFYRPPDQGEPSLGSDAKVRLCA